MNVSIKHSGLGFFGVLAVIAGIFYCAYGKDSTEAFHLLVSRSSLLLTGAANFESIGGGFTANILISVCAMVISTVFGVLLGTGMTSQNAVIRGPCVALMNIMRNSPWLVVLYAMLYLIPFRINVGGVEFWVSPFFKAVVGLSVPVTAYMAEVFRNGIQTIPMGQWESALSLGYRRGAILRRIVLPQALPQMLPNIMTTYAMLFIGTSLVVITGTSDVLSIAKTVIASDGDRFATAIYLYILLIFFSFCYPISVASRVLESHLRRNR